MGLPTALIVNSSPSRSPALVSSETSHPGVEALGVLGHPLLELECGLVDMNSLIWPGVSGFLSSQANDQKVFRFLHLHDAGVAHEVDVRAQQQPERRLVQRDAILVVEIEVLDGEVVAVGNDDLARRTRVVEAEATRTLDVELALHALVVGARLDEVALQRVEIAEIAGDLVDELGLPRIERDAVAGAWRGDLGAPAGRGAGGR